MAGEPHLSESWLWRRLASATEKGPISFRPQEVIGPAHPFSKTPGKGGPHLLQQDPWQSGFRVSLQQDSRVLAGTSPVTPLYIQVTGRF